MRGQTDVAVMSVLTPADCEAARRAELAAFLRSRRDRLRPEEVGLQPGLRRRTPGLRREEVADLASIGVTWYTWLEQGRSIHPSPQVVDSIARALRLDHTEHGHLYALCGVERPAYGPSRESVSPQVHAILNALSPMPAYVTNQRYDVLAWNDGIVALYGDFAGQDQRHRNILWRMFTDRTWERLFIDYERVARRVVAQFRAAMGGHVGEPAWSDLVEGLRATSPRFEQIWSEHELAGPEPRTKQLMHPTAGLVRIDYTLMRAAEAPNLRVMVYTPADTASAGALSTLLDATLHGAEAGHAIQSDIPSWQPPVEEPHLRGLTTPTSASLSANLRI